MSLIVGIRCADSVVLAASGPASVRPSQGLPPARQLTKRLRVVAGQAVLGVSGHDGLAQEMGLSLGRYLAEPNRRDSGEEILRAEIREALAAPVQRTVAIHRTLEGLPGFGSLSSEYAVTHSLVALPLRGALRLYVLEPECSLTEITEELCCVAVGPAGTAAAPFLAFLRKLLFDSDAPTLTQGELAAYWTVRQAIDSNPGGLSYPIQVVAISRAQEGSIEISERGEQEIAALGEAVEAREERMREGFRNNSPAGGDGAGKLAADSTERPMRKRVPEVRLTLQPPGRREPQRW